ncbi:MAG: hypothetical protein M1817_003285 [Caeruleum heppii]|nr:MAG: hypothetical protein M1817_003285 [Caeruleum heppii]
MRPPPPLRTHLTRYPSSTHHLHPFSTSPSSHADHTHVITGGGAIGLSIAHHLTRTHPPPHTKTLLLERHPTLGLETSRRNSCVIHAGLYYGPSSLKTKLCLRGRELLYNFCAENDVAHRRTGKWIVAQTEGEWQALERLRAHAERIGVETRVVGTKEARREEPDLRAEVGVLESPTTGIVDSAGLMRVLRGRFEDQGGEVRVNTPVKRFERDDATGEYIIHTTSSADSSPQRITTETLINAAGLFAIPLSNTLLPSTHHHHPYYAKGSYYTYTRPFPTSQPRRLIYPAPSPHISGGLGTHLTLSLGGAIRFGPDVEWTTSPTDYSVNTSRLEEAIAAVQTYLPGLDPAGFEPAYAGIRPKLSEQGGATWGSEGFRDFYFKEETEVGMPGFVNLLGVESPGLTSCLAVGEWVEGLLYR